MMKTKSHSDRRAAAHKLLDRAKAGEPISERDITQALIDSGDLPAFDVNLIPHREWRAAQTWELENARLMACATWLDPAH